MRARILSQGDEILTGATLDTNAHWLAGELWQQGAEVVGFAAAADDLDELARVLEAASGDVELVVSTGGLGPTDDDLSAEAAARAARVGLEENAVARAQVEAHFARYKRPMSPANLKQARLPAGAEVLANPAGSAPGFALRIGAARCLFFPGVPRELEVMAEIHLFPWLAARGLETPLKRRLHVCGLGESQLQDRLTGLKLPDGVRLGYRTWLPFNTVILYGRGGNSDALDQARCEVAERLGIEVYGEDETTLPRAVGDSLRALGWKVAIAESCTAGLAAGLLTQAPGSGDCLLGGVVAYDNEVKRRLLDVPAAVLERDGAVSEACALAMARGVRRATGADVGLAITGIAGPTGGSPEKPVGLVCFGLAAEGEERAHSVRYGDRGRDVLRTLAAAHALEWLRRFLLSR